MVEGHAIDDDMWRLRKAKTLMKLLALAPRHQMHRERVIDTLWPDLDPAAANNNLHKALYAARHILQPASRGPSSYLHLQGSFVILSAPGDLWMDVAAFRAAAHKARLTQDPHVYEEAIELYTGDLLPEDLYEDWAYPYVTNCAPC